MRLSLNILVSAMIFLSLTSFSGCRKKAVTDGENDYTISQRDIDLFIMNKYKIDEITSRFDKLIEKAQRNEKKTLIEEGKNEINGYLLSQGLNPELFMRKSKKILKCYLAFQETHPKKLQRIKSELEKKEVSPELIKQELEFYQNASKRLFESYTRDLTEYEVALIKANIEKISQVMDRAVLPESKE